jgi:hypothetical protein
VSERRAQRMAAAWFLGAIAIAVVAFLWARGAARLLLPVLLIAGAGWAVTRLLRVLRAPVD